ncbi:Chaperone protein dnak, partial [Globisporangium splendens]
MALRKRSERVPLLMGHARVSGAAIRHFHATQQQPVWFLAAGAGFAALYLGSRYVVRAQERLRRQRAGLPVDEEDANFDDDAYAATPARRMSEILGVDFGTANLRLSTVSLASTGNGYERARVIESADGLRAIPAAVAVDNDNVSVGVLAKSLMGRKPGYTGTATRVLLERSSVNWAAEILLDYVHSMAARSLGEEKARVGFPTILSVPAGLNEQERGTLERVASSAGFEVVSSVDEPIAALHAVERSAIEDQDDEALSALTGSAPGATIAVFDMGGYKSSVTLLQRSNATFNVLQSAATFDVSGKAVDALLFDRVVGKFKQETGIDLSIDPMASFRVLEAVETAKIELSSRRSTDLNLPFITADRTGAKHLVQKLSAYDLVRACEGQVKWTTALCDDVLASAGITKRDIAQLVLVGGGVRSDPIREHLESYFGRKAFSGRNFKPEEAVVVGAAEFGRRLSSEA